MEEKTSLEKELESFGMPRNYEEHSSYSRLQQFQAYVTERLAKKSADEIIDLCPENLMNLGQVVLEREKEGDSKKVLKIYAQNDNYILECCHSYGFGERHKRSMMISISPKEIKKYIKSALYRRMVNLIIDKTRRIALHGTILDSPSKCSKALNELQQIMALKPNNIFKKIYEECVRDIEELAKPFLAIVGHVEETIGGFDEKKSPSQEEWELEFERCVEHIEKLK